MDAFSFGGTQISGWVFNGGGGNNTLTVVSTLKTTPVTFTGGSAGNNSVIGPNVPATWTLSKANGGTLTTTPGSGTVSFSQVQNRIGGMASDAFVFKSTAAVVSHIDGGGGGDWLDYAAFPSTAPVHVDLIQNLATNIHGSAAGGIANIQNVRGGAGNDTLIGGGGNILVGGAGNDTLVDTYAGTSKAGGSLLIGGLGADSLTGGNAGDILIGEYTVYDTKNTNLQDILNEWDTAPSHAAAFTALHRSTGLPGTREKLIFGSTGTVKDDSSTSPYADLLTGASSPADVDWFFAGLSDTTNARHALDYLNNGLA